MKKNVYILHNVHKAAEIQEILANAQGVVYELDGKPNENERDAVNSVEEVVGDIWEQAEDFNNASEWVKPLENINNAIQAIHNVGWQLYAALVDKNAMNPLTGKREAIKVIFLVSSKQNSETLDYTPAMDAI